MDNINYIELNAILYYADFLSIQEVNHPITDTCKYFFINGAPINASFIAETEPFYNEDNEYFKQSKNTYLLLRNKFGEDGVMSFIDDVCSLRACGCVGGIDMLRCARQYDSKFEKKLALKDYNNWVNSLKYTHLTQEEDGKFKRVACSKHIAHLERSTGAATEPQLHTCDEQHETKKEEK